MQAKCVVGAVLLLLVTGSVEAARAAFDPKAEAKGGFAPVTDAKYQSECGACHFAYLPGMLPARSWDALLTQSNEHFGEALSLDPASLQQIRNFLTTNAADRSDFIGSEIILRRLSDHSTPLRITNLPAFKGYHFSVLNTLGLVHGMYSRRDLPPNAVKAVLNCNTCHERAAAGSFAQQEMVVPGARTVPF
jgi:cytochrome c553